jgi:hypothetical protein
MHRLTDWTARTGVVDVHEAVDAFAAAAASERRSKQPPSGSWPTSEFLEQNAPSCALVRPADLANEVK